MPANESSACGNRFEDIETRSNRQETFQLMLKAADLGQSLLRALRQQRIGVGAAISAAVLLIGVFHAPAVPVLAGCAGGLIYLLLRAWNGHS